MRISTRLSSAQTASRCRRQLLASRIRAGVLTGQHAKPTCASTAADGRHITVQALTRTNHIGFGDSTFRKGAAAAAFTAAVTWQLPVAAAAAGCAGSGWAWHSGALDPAPLEVRGDAFDGVTVIASSIAPDPSAFAKQLDASLQAWTVAGRRGVWLKIPIEKAGLIEVAVKRGFIFHHAEAAYVMLTRWLPTDCPSPLPANASTQVGVGAVVINDEGRVLLVQEAVGPLRGRDVWKIPTGLLDAREDIHDGVVREVLEETGVNAVFERVLAFRHWHGAMFGKSDMFFVCILRARGCRNDTPFQLQPAEIAKAKWGDFGEFLQQAPYPRDSPQWARIYGLALPFCHAMTTTAGDNGGFVAENLQHGMGRPGSCMIYHTNTTKASNFELRPDAVELDAEVVRKFDELSNS